MVNLIQTRPERGLVPVEPVFFFVDKKQKQGRFAPLFLHQIEKLIEIFNFRGLYYIPWKAIFQGKSFTILVLTRLNITCKIFTVRFDLGFK